jgi:hypothetical protein
LKDLIDMMDISDEEAGPAIPEEGSKDREQTKSREAREVSNWQTRDGFDSCLRGLTGSCSPQVFADEVVHDEVIAATYTSLAGTPEAEGRLQAIAEAAAGDPCGT